MIALTTHSSAYGLVVALVAIGIFVAVIGLSLLVSKALSRKFTRTDRGY